VNTAAVHALSYPLGGEFHVAHGISNAVLLPHVMDFNLPTCPERYAEVALALGAQPRASHLETARQGVQRVRELALACGVPLTLSALKVPRAALPRLAEAAVGVTRLLKNNPREVTLADAVAVYEQAY